VSSEQSAGALAKLEGIGVLPFVNLRVYLFYLCGKKI